MPKFKVDGPPKSDSPPNHPISYEDAGKMKGASAVLYKVRDWGSFYDKIRKLPGLPDGIKETLCNSDIYLGKGRTKPHLFRLLGRDGGPELEFGIAFVRHAPEYFARNDEETKHDIADVLDSESTDTMMWWTFAPYLYKVLTGRGVDEREAVFKILHWAKTSTEQEDNTKRRDSFNLKGLEIFGNLIEANRYALSEDTEHITHKFTEQEARRIVTDVFGVKDSKAT